jgi:hypothetical protein
MLKKWITLLSATTLLLFSICTFTENNTVYDTKKHISLQTEVYKIGNGYGYKLWSNNKLLVKQDFIPAYPGKQPFASYKDAQKVATLVLQRIKLGEDPRVSKEDLEQLLTNIPTLDF